MKGSITGINYIGDFTLYKRMLLSDSAKMKGVYSWYNKHIFAQGEKTTSNPSALTGLEESFELLMRTVNDESDSTTESENHLAGNTGIPITASSNKHPSAPISATSATPSASANNDATSNISGKKPSSKSANAKAPTRVVKKRQASSRTAKNAPVDNNIVDNSV